MKEMKKKLLVLAGVLCMGLLLFGCGKEKTEDKEEIKKEEPAEKEEPENTCQVIGRESEDAYDILLTNKTDNVITGIQIKSSKQTEYPANMMGSSQKIEKDETVELYYTPETAKEDQPEEAESGGNAGR